MIKPSTNKGFAKVGVQCFVNLLCLSKILCIVLTVVLIHPAIANNQNVSGQTMTTQDQKI